jgi:putative redox protein
MGKKSQSTMRTDTGFKLETDVPLDMGGENSAPQPVETLLAALVGCTQATALFVGRQMEPRILLESLDFDLTAVRDQRGALELPITELPSVPAQLQCVEGTITVYIKQSKRELARVLTDEELTLFSQQTEARCPVASMMMASGCEFKIKWVNGEVAPPPRDD